jgi:hypothetical protein
VTGKTEANAIREAIESRFACYVDLIEARLQPVLTTSVMTGADWAKGEADITIDGKGFGLLHEQIATVIEIAERHGGRAFIDPNDGRLSIVWPSTLVPDPEPTEPQKHRAKARGTAKAVIA